jgi:ATP-dependent RNA helicase DDX5/DBP2
LNIEDYIHRIGRTGRAGAQGIAISFFTEKTSKLARELIDILHKANQNIPPQLRAFAPERSYGGGPTGHYGAPRPSYGGPRNF